MFNATHIQMIEIEKLSLKLNFHVVEVFGIDGPMVTAS
jgi:hypothetical protein